MPRKSCCCNTQPPPEGSCCRPIYNGCVGRRYSFTTKVKVKYPCWKNFQFVQNTYECLNGVAEYPIQDNFETFELTVYYTIQRPVRQQQYIWPSPHTGSRSTNSCSCSTELWNGCDGGRRWNCAGSNFNPMDGDTWPPRDCDPNSIGLPGTLSCQPAGDGCACRTGIYSTCNFGDNNLKTCDTYCDSGAIAWSYKCGGELRFCDTENQIPSPCGSDGFGNLYYPTDITPGEPPNNFWQGCYKGWLLESNSQLETDHEEYIIPFSFPPCACCTFNAPTSSLTEISDSYTFQFIPDPNILEQNDPDYIPKIQPNLLYFWVGCGAFGSSELDTLGGVGVNSSGYEVGMKLGFGYRAEFNCTSGQQQQGGGQNIEVVDIPWKEYEDPFFGISSQGPTVYMRYNRGRLPNDPMNSCLPVSSQNVLRTECPGLNTGFGPICEYGSLYIDDYNLCYFSGPIVRFRTSVYSEPFDPELTYNNYCNPVVDPDGSVTWPQCSHVIIDYRMDVERLA